MFEGIAESTGEEAGFEAVGAEEGLLRDGQAFKGEGLLGVGGLVEGEEVVAEVGNFVEVLEADYGEGGAVKPCLRAFWEERALPSEVRGPVDFWALARLAES
jgi:hypothetical protein